MMKLEKSEREKKEKNAYKDAKLRKPQRVHQLSLGGRRRDRLARNAAPDTSSSPRRRDLNHVGPLEDSVKLLRVKRALAGPIIVEGILRGDVGNDLGAEGVGEIGGDKVVGVNLAVLAGYRPTRKKRRGRKGRGRGLKREGPDSVDIRLILDKDEWGESDVIEECLDGDENDCPLKRGTSRA